MESLTETIASRTIERSVEERRTAYVEEIRRIVEATYRVIERTGEFDPKLRDILRESGTSTQAFYKYFRSKDELLLLLLDDGRRRLLGYLSHRMDKATTPAGRVRAWIEGVLAQASDEKAAARTRPFLANRDRLAEAFPAEQQTSVDLLVDLLAGSIEALPGRGKSAKPREDAQAIYDVTFGALYRFITRGKRPGPGETKNLVRFNLGALSVRT